MAKSANPLPPRHERFAQELANGVDAKRAYVSAGFKKNDGNAYRLNKKDTVRNRVEAILSERGAVHAAAIAQAIERTGISIGRVLEELAKIGFADIRKAVSWGEGIAVEDENGQVRIANGVSLVSSDDVDDDTASAIAEISQTKDGLKIKLHDKRAALVDIGRHLGMFKDRVEMSGSLDVLVVELIDG